MNEIKYDLELSHFPAKHQAVIFRNWGMVCYKKLAEILRTSESNIKEAGFEMGLKDNGVNENWLNKGFITIIRNNWHILNKRQLIELLGWSEEKFDITLKEDDFLEVKLGLFKPLCDDVFFRELTDEEKIRTKEILRTIKKVTANNPKDVSKPFEFEYVCPDTDIVNNSNFKTKIAYSYYALYGDSLLDEKINPYSDELLEKFQKLGINGIWMQGILYQLTPFKFNLNYSKNYEKRLAGLRKLVERAQKYGIKVYLYLNEPRSFRLDFFEKFPHLKGYVEGEYASLCTSENEVKEYIVDSIKYLCDNVKSLGGFFTITASENLTNCYSHSYSVPSSCEKCNKRTNIEVISEVNNLIYEGIKKSNSDAKLIAWNWGWVEGLHFNLKDNIEITRNLDKDIAVMCVSEENMLFKKYGNAVRVMDYSISVVGPSTKTKTIWKDCKKQNREIFAKIQLNNSWECACVPYIPVFPTIIKHLKKLSVQKVDGLMLSWTLGGYPSASINLLNYDYSFSEEDILKKFINDYFKIETENILQAVKLFSKAFSYFPFSIYTLYYAPQNLGISNLLYKNKTNLASGMVCFPYDNIELWMKEYNKEVYLKLWKKLTSIWKKGLKYLDNVKELNPQVIELISLSKALNIAYSSTLNQINYILNRENNTISKENKTVFQNKILRKEISLAKEMLLLQAENSKIGFEASNHYFYYKNNLLEKIINCNNLIIK